MTAPDRAYDPNRRPNTFYKGDKKSNAELATRALQRGQSMARDRAQSLSDDVSDSIGFDMAEGADEISAKVSSSGKKLTNIHGKKGVKGEKVTNARSSDMPISGTRLGKTKSMMEGRPQA